jgi:hypothetical protein
MFRAAAHLQLLAAPAAVWLCAVVNGNVGSLPACAGHPVRQCCRGCGQLLLQGFTPACVLVQQIKPGLLCKEAQDLAHGLLGQALSLSQTAAAEQHEQESKPGPSHGWMQDCRSRQGWRGGLQGGRGPAEMAFAR